MPTAKNRLYVIFYKPSSWIGRVIVSRTNDEYSHSGMVLDDVLYETKFPKVEYTPLRQSIYDETDLILEMDIDDLERSLLLKFFENHKGRWYDILAMIGWLLGIRRMQFHNNTSCHEFVRQAFTEIGRLLWSPDLITAKRLLDEIGLWHVGAPAGDRAARRTNLSSSIRIHYWRGGTATAG